MIFFKMVKTKIVCTLGPSTNNLKVISGLKKAGVSVFRVNTAHGDFSQYQRFVDFAKKVSVPVMLDLKGPDLRICLKEPLKVKKMELVKIFRKKFPYFNYDIIDSLRKNDLVFFDNGLIKSKVKEKSKDCVLLEFQDDAVVLENKGVNVPNRRLKVPNLSGKDLDVIKFAKKNKVDFVALSFVRNKEDVLRLRKLTDSLIVSKIENNEGLKNIKEIVMVSDAVMIARGDLAVEIGKENVPFVQKNIVDLCNEFGKSCIVATQMFESMVYSVEPTRAEVSDVANAVMDGADAVMLSGETAVGKHPILVIKELSSVLKEADNHVLPKVFEVKNDSESLIGAASSLLFSLDISKIVCLTSSGYTASMISRYRVGKKVIAVTNNDLVSSLLVLSWSVESLVMGKKHVVSAKTLLKRLKFIGVLKNSDKVLLLRNKKEYEKKVTNAIELYDVKDL